MAKKRKKNHSRHEEIRRKQIKTLVLRIGVVVLIIIIILLLRQWFAAQPHQEPVVHVTSAEVAQFRDMLEGRVVTEIGQPIEGFTPQMFRQVYPDLSESDFDGVEAVGGVYYYTIEDSIAFRTEGEEEATSTTRTITKEGMETLLQNVVGRLKVDTSDEGWLEKIKKKIKSDERGVRKNIVLAHVGQGSFLHGLVLTPLEIVEDSRCPVGTECVQAGTVRVKVQLKTKNEKTTEVFTLSETQRVYHRLITLADVEPNMKTEGEIGKDEYQFHFRVEKEQIDQKDQASE